MNGGLSDSIEEAAAMGRRNQEIIELASRWCRHIRLDRSQSGFGMVEQMTGLPVSGGAFRCDYAVGPTTSGMRLDHIAVDFYEANCVGCLQREPVDLPPHLGSYAQDAIDKRNRDRLRHEEEQKARDEAAATRRGLRRTALAETPDTAFVLSLLDNLDRPDMRVDAARGLREQAKLDLAPVAAAIPALTDPASFPQDDSVLDVLDMLDRAGLIADSACVVSLALRGVIESWGPSGSRLLARHAVSEHLGNTVLIQRLAFLAAPVREWVLQDLREPDPEALLAYAAIDTRLVGEQLTIELRHGDDRRRACAAGASSRLLLAFPDLLAALVPGALDGLRLADGDRYSLTHPTARLQSFLALALIIDPRHTDAAVGRRWTNATDGYRERLLGSYQRMLDPDRPEDATPRPALEETSVAAAVARASNVLTEPVRPLTALNSVAQDAHEAQLELQRTAVEIFSAAAEQDRAAFSTDALLGTLALLVDARWRTPVEPRPPASHPTLRDLGESSRRIHLDFLIRKLGEALVAWSQRDRDAWWDLLEQAWGETESDNPLRPELLKIAVEVSLETFTDLHKPVPYVYGSLVGPTARLRATAVRCVGKLAERGLALPDVVSETAWELRNDPETSVIAAAVRALPKVHRIVEAAPQRRLDLANWLLGIAQACGSESTLSDMASDAIVSAVRLSETQPWEDQAWRVAMTITGDQNPYDGGRTLMRLRPWDDRPATEWAAAVSTVLRYDARPDYAGLQDNDRADLLRPFLRLRREVLEAVFKETPVGASLAETARTYLPQRVPDALAVADVLVHGQAWELAQQITEDVVAVIPDVPATHRWHIEAAYRSARCRTEAAIARNDMPAADAAIRDAAEFESRATGVYFLAGWTDLRRELLDALQDIATANGDPDAIGDLADRLSCLEPTGRAGDRVAVYQTLLRALSNAARWHPAALAADPNPDRFARAARELSATIQTDATDGDLRQIAAQIENLGAYADVPEIARALAAVSLPPRLSDLAPFRTSRFADIKKVDIEPPPAVALHIDIQAPHSGSAMLLTPGAIVPVTATAAVPEWPPGAETLEITFASTLTPSMLHVSPIVIARSETIAHGSIQITGYMPLLGKPAEITVNAAFRIRESPYATRVFTHPSFRIVTTDPSFGLVNLPRAQEQLRLVLSDLQKRHPAWAERSDARDAVLLVSGLIRFSHNLTDDTAASAPEPMDEKAFQRRLKEFLRADPNIGARLQEAPRAAGGITDLVLGETVLELKVEQVEPVTLQGVDRYLGQPTIYASSRDRVVSLLAVLDDSPKNTDRSAAPIGDQLGWFEPPLHGQTATTEPTSVIAVVLSRRFPRPSDLSR